MTPLATVLYEDSKIGKLYPLHDLILRMVEDDIDGKTWRLHKAVADNPRKSIDKVLRDISHTSLIAGAGKVFILADRDQITRHINQHKPPEEPVLSPNAADPEIVDAMLRMSDAPKKLEVFFLQPNLEGLIDAVGQCAPGQWSTDIRNAKRKDRGARDFVLQEVAKATMAGVRTCVRAQQPGLDGLVKALTALIPPKAIT
jgi:hypothetical protein